MMRLARGAPQALSSTSSRGADSMLATAETLMPSARVSLLQLDSASRSVLASVGITDTQPRAYIQAAPYGADCRTIRPTDTTAWTQAGDTGYVVATLAPRDQWVDGIPVLVIPDMWNYPYPRNTGLTTYPPSPPPYASPDALFSFGERVTPAPDWYSVDKVPADTIRSRVSAWARAHVVQRELEPIRSRIRNLVSGADFERISTTPSRFRGTYRIHLRDDDSSATWQFRTVDRPAYRWGAIEVAQTIADIIEAPFVPGYSLVGYAADSAGIVPVVSPRGAAERRLVWLSVADRPSAPGNDTTRVLAAMVEFVRVGAPVSIWDALDVYVRRLPAADSAFIARAGVVRTRADDQPRLPLTLRIGRDGSIAGDTTLVRDGRRLRVTLTRVDTVSVRRPF